MVGNNLAQARSIFIALTAYITKKPSLVCAAHIDIVVPKCYREAMKSPLWKAAIDRELAAHAKNITWRIVPRLPPGRKAIGNKYIFRLKLNADGTPDKAKCRLAGKGYTQKYGSDYFETFAPTLLLDTARLALSIAAADDLEFDHLDVETAFLQGELKEELYLELPEGVREHHPPGSVALLLKPIYGTKQAGRCWNITFTTQLKKQGYTASAHDSCLFLKRSQTGRLLILPVFVDDIFPIYHHTDAVEMSADIKQLMSVFSMKHLGPCSLMLGASSRKSRCNLL